VKPIRIGFLTTDNREPFRQYDNPEPWFGTAPKALLDGFASLSEVEIHVVTCSQKPMVSSPTKLADNIWFYSLQVSKLGWLRTGYQGCIRAMRWKLREISPDLVHGQGTERECSLAAIFSGFPNLITIHGNMRQVARTQRAKPFSFYWLAARLEQFTLPRTDGVICLSRHTQKQVNGLAPKTWQIPNAVDASFFEVSRNPDELPTMLCVGSICPWKNQNGFIRALDEVASKLQFRIVFLGQAGDDPYGREFHRLLATRAWCEYAGFADREELKGWLSRARLLALPSLEENCPMVVLEAMAAGVPVIAANVGGVPDLIEDGETGLLCNPLDEAGMADATERLLCDSNLAGVLTENARRKAFATYHPTVIARQHLQIYRELLSSK
jgi:glycosyltransferase involved in cell wall biosynthesis